MSGSEVDESGGGFFALATALRAFIDEQLGGVPSDRALADTAGVTATTVGDWLRGRRFPQEIEKVLVVVATVRRAAAARGIAVPPGAPDGLLEKDQWQTAHQAETQRRAGAFSVRPKRAAALRAGEADLRRLGVHEAITVPGTAAGVLPEYVPRDADTGEGGIRAQLSAAAQRGGFVLLVGGSSVGKTRTAAEALRAVLPDWRLVHPGGPAEVAAVAAALPPRTVLWLDELQRYLDGEHGLTGGTIRALLSAGHPVVIIGTLWPDRYTSWTARPGPGEADPHAREREVLDLATVIRLGEDFSPAEQDRARAAAARDPQLRAALATGGYGLTQTLAAVPQLVARWEDARAAHPYGWAVLTAALDITRLGARAPLTADLLRAAAVDYCTSTQQAEAPANWFEQALAYSTEKLHGAAAALRPVAAGMGQVAGYIAADYLVQHATRKRRYARVPASTWKASTSSVRDPADATWLASSAHDRLLYQYATPLCHHAITMGDGHAGWLLADMLRERGDLEGLRAQAVAGNGYAAAALADMLRGRGDLDGAVQVLRLAADAGDRSAAETLADMLRGRGDLEELRDRADAGDVHATALLADVLRGCGDRNGAVRMLRPAAVAGDRYAAELLADMLREREDLDGLRARADAGDRYAAELLAGMLVERGDLKGLRARADAGDRYAAAKLASMLREREDLDGLRARADAGDRYAAELLAGMLVERGDLKGLRARADAGDRYAAAKLASMLRERGDLDGAVQVLRPAADAGDRYAAEALAGMLRERGDLEGLRARAVAGDRYAAELLADMLREREDLDGLRARADAGDRYAAEALAGMLVERGDLEGLRARAVAGDRYAAAKLADMLRERGDLDGAVQVLRPAADAGDGYAAAEALAGMLVERGDLEGLRARAVAGDRSAAAKLASMLIKQGRHGEAEQLRRFGLNADGSTASE